MGLLIQVHPVGEEPKLIMNPDLILEQEDQLDIIHSMHAAAWDLRTTYMGYKNDGHDLELEEDKAEVQQMLAKFQDLHGN